MMESISVSLLRDLSGGAIGAVDVACPWCGPQRRSPVNRRRKVLRVWDDGDFVTFACIRCGEKGWARDDRAAHVTRPQRQTPPKPDRTDLVRRLWGRSVPASGTVVETYLRGRSCWLASPNIRLLPAADKHLPAMIVRFGSYEPTGIHLTRLKRDGSGKAGTESDKIMIGECVGQPLVIHDNPDRGELVIAEGNEDAASFALALGWSAWAAGSAGRIPHVLVSAGHFEKVYLAVDDDRAGQAALKRARMIAPVIPVRISRIVKGLDANGLMARYGQGALAAAVEWCALQHEFSTGRIGFNAMQNGMGRITHAIPGSSAVD